MSSNFGVKQTLDLLEKLRATVADFAAREQKLTHEFSAAITAERHRRDKVVEQLNNRRAEALVEAEGRHLAVNAGVTEKFSGRKARIAQALKSTNKRAFKRIEDYEGFRKHKLQTETLQAQRNQETSLVNAEKKFVEFRQTLAGEHD
ncbi:MAG: hypothetical protein ABIV39_17180, partial [Verrucomicrobiota bacterium]